MGIELRYTCLNCKPSQSTRLPPGVSGTSRTSGNLASDRPDWVDIPRTLSAFGNGKIGQEGSLLLGRGMALVNTGGRQQYNLRDSVSPDL